MRWWKMLLYTLIIVQSLNSADMSSAGSIQIPGLEYPSDIAACNVTNKLFVLGRWPDNALWRLSPSPLAVEARYALKEGAEAMSVRNGMVLMATKSTGKLITFDGSTGQQTKVITVSKMLYLYYHSHLTQGNAGTD